MACEDPDCHCEDGIDWDYLTASQCASDLVFYTQNCYRLATEYTFDDDGSLWTVTLSCDISKPNPHCEPKTMQPMPVGFEPAQSDLKAIDGLLAKLVETLKIMKVAEFEDSREDDYGSWKILARWNGPFEKDPRWPVNPDQAMVQ